MTETTEYDVKVRDMPGRFPPGPWRDAQVAMGTNGAVAIVGEGIRWVGFATDLKGGVHPTELHVVRLRAENLGIDVWVDDAMVFLSKLEETHQAATHGEAVSRAKQSGWVPYWAAAAAVLVVAAVGMVSADVSQATFNGMMGVIAAVATGGAVWRNRAWRDREAALQRSGETPEVPEVSVPAYVAFSAVLLVGTGLVASEADLSPQAFGWAMTGATVAIFGGAVFLRTRVLFGKIGTWVGGLAVLALWMGGQAAALIWVSRRMLADELHLGWFWTLAVGAWWLALAGQAAWFLLVGVDVIREKAGR